MTPENGLKLCPRDFKESNGLMGLEIGLLCVLDLKFEIYVVLII